jgi:two-component system sensor histidine kinase/response regulator
VIGKFGDLVKKKKIKIDKPDKNIKAFFDAAIISKVLQKIIHNAIKFSDEGTNLKIIIKEGSGLTDTLVMNSGPALSQSKIDQILKPFTLDEDVMNHSQGMGLGLSVSQSLLKTHESKLFIQSSSPRTTVGFSLKGK